MSQLSLFEKLQFKGEKNLLIQGLPSSIEKQFSKLSFSKNVTPLLKTKRVEFALIFAVSQSQLNSILKEVIPVLHKEAKLWVAHPKSASKILTDLNRDTCWSYLTNAKFEATHQIDIDHVWTAMRFKQMEQTTQARVRMNGFAVLKPTSIESVGYEAREMASPIKD